MNLPENRDTAESFDRIPWHKPLVQRLVIAVDTRAGGGSVIDQDGFDFIVQDEVINV
jgi:hypothetical protein